MSLTFVRNTQLSFSSSPPGVDYTLDLLESQLIAYNLLDDSRTSLRHFDADPPPFSGRIVQQVEDEFGWQIENVPFCCVGFRKYGTNSNQQNVEAFLAIPYAAPPVGSLRFLPPASPGPWPGIRPANNLPPVCPQQMPDLTNRYLDLHVRFTFLRFQWSGVASDAQHWRS